MKIIRTVLSAVLCTTVVLDYLYVLHMSHELGPVRGF